MDAMVLKTQQYLNAIYGKNAGYTVIEENGRTGWTTIYALTRAFQIELGITETADNFGATTIRLFKEQYPNGIIQQASGDTTTSRVYAIIQGALWCKGYGTGASGITEHFYGGTGSAIISLKRDAGYESPDSTVTLNVMKALLSMNQYVTIYSQGGTDLIRNIQRQLNRKYEDYIGLIPCDGLYGREMNKALIFVLQAIEGLSVEEATGNFGQQTKLKVPILPDTSGALTGKAVEEATYLLKYALCCNGYTLSISNADWDDTLVATIREFQSDLKLNETGTANIDTWMSLLLSKGNPDRACVACDTRFEITTSRATELKEKNYSIVGRYLTGTDYKALREDEPQRILDNGLYFFPIFQESSNSVSYFTEERGKADAENAVRAARKYRIPEGNVIYFAVDLDATAAQITSHVMPYFATLSENMDTAYKIGVYGTRNVCTQVCNAQYAVTCFVSDMSTGYSGNMGFKIPSNWNFDQYAEIDMDTTTDGKWAVDKDAYAGRYAPVNELDDYIYVQPDKTQITGSAVISEVIPLIEELEDLYVAWYTPLFEAAPQTIPYLSATVLARGITNFIRSIAYSDLKWIISLSAADEGFIDYVKEQNETLYNRLQPYMVEGENAVLVSDGQGGLIDFKHLAATAEGYFASSVLPDSWHGWAGDLATAIIDINSAVINYTGYQAAADAVIGDSSHSFPFEDICSDADAIKIAELVSASSSRTHSFSEALRSYYNNYACNRFSYLVDDIGSLANLTSLKQKINDRLGVVLMAAVSVYAKDLPDYEAALRDLPSIEAYVAGCNAFANYIYCELA